MKIAVVDYGMGNIYSVVNAIEFLGEKVTVSSDRSVVKDSDVVILPGVGSFKPAIQILESTGLGDAIRECVLINKRKILGICLGMQLLAKSSEEGGLFEGLNMIKTTVQRFNGDQLKKIPHIGFNQVQNPASESLLFKDIKDNSDFYFVHSYKLNDADVMGHKAICRYGEESFIAAYEHENIFATQFHPEKSQTSGLRLLKNFLQI